MENGIQTCKILVKFVIYVTLSFKICFIVLWKFNWEQI